MELKEHKSALAALATLGVTAVAAGATAFVKIREKRRQRKALEALEEETGKLSAEQRMVYNEGIKAFLTLNDRIYELRRRRNALQPIILWLASKGEKPQTEAADGELKQLVDSIAKFKASQMPFINACLMTLTGDEATFADYLRAPVGEAFDQTLDEEPTGADVTDGTPVTHVLKLGYCFPDCTIAAHPTKSIVLV